MDTSYARHAKCPPNAAKAARLNSRLNTRIGIYAGTFDPVHAGHIATALQAVEHAALDRLYFLPERRPRSKKGVEHFGHRTAMLRQATAPHPRLDMLELEDTSFTVEYTLPRLRKHFRNKQLVFIMGSDAARQVPGWPKVERLLARHELAIALRRGDHREDVENAISEWPMQPASIKLFESYAPGVSSWRIRDALRRNERVGGLLRSVERYSRRNWLYISLSQQIKPGSSPNS